MNFATVNKSSTAFCVCRIATKRRRLTNLCELCATSRSKPMNKRISVFVSCCVLVSFPGICEPFISIHRSLYLFPPRRVVCAPHSAEPRAIVVQTGLTCKGKAKSGDKAHAKMSVCVCLFVSPFVRCLFVCAHTRVYVEGVPNTRALGLFCENVLSVGQFNSGSMLFQISWGGGNRTQQLHTGVTRRCDVT